MYLCQEYITFLLFVLPSIQSDWWHKRWVVSSPKERRYMTHIFSEKAGKQHALGVLAPSPRDPKSDFITFIVKWESCKKKEFCDVTLS